jgi:hypothetical protein
MAYAIRTGRPYRASGDMALHLLEVMHVVLEASATGQHIELTSTCDHPAALAAGLPERHLDP